MASTTTRGLLVLAVFLGGIIAGFSLNRVLVDMPAWRSLGAETWARFTRQADLRTGLVVYPVEGMAALLVTAAAAIGFHRDRHATPAAAVPVYAAAFGAVLAFIVTRFALAPYVLSLREVTSDVGALNRVMSQAERWWRVKATLHVLTFASNVWALVAAKW
jgi:hypothetical protein